MKQPLKIGTRESQLAVWQATLVKNLLKETGVDSELVFIKSEGDIDAVTPLYELGVQGIFTKALDAALLNNRIDIAVHSMKDVPTKLAKGITQAAVLKRGNYKDILVLHPDIDKRNNRFTHERVSITTIGSKKRIKENKWILPLREDVENPGKPEKIVIATSSIRRISQWLNYNPDTKIENLRGNVNTRLKKLKESNWHGAIFAAAGLERIGLRPENSIDLDWMLPAPAQGAITISCRENDDISLSAAVLLNDEATAICTKIERDFLRTLLGGCSTPISALAIIENDKVIFRGNICSTDGKQKIEVEKKVKIENGDSLGIIVAEELLKNEKASEIIYSIRNAKK